MGNSTQQVDGRYLTLNDWDLIAVVSLANLVTEETEEKERVGKIVGAWNRALEVSGPGTIDLNLPGASVPDERHCVRELLKALKHKTISFGEFVPASVLQRSGSAIFLKDFSCRRIVETLDRIENLLG